MSIIFVVAIIDSLGLARDSRMKINSATTILMMFLSELDIQDNSNKEVEYEYCT